MKLTNPRKLLLVGVICSATGVSGAADWQFDPYIEAGALYNDNYTLTAVESERVDLSGVFVDAGIQWRAETPRSNWTFEPRIRSLYYPDYSDFETTDYFLQLRGEQRNQRSAFGLSADYSDQDIVQGQLPNADLGDASLGQGGGPDSGRILGDNRQREFRARPYLQFELSERVQLRLEGRAEDVSFDRDVVNFQESYQTLGVAALLERRFTPASRFGIRVDYQQSEPDSGFGKADLTGLQLQWDYQVGERVTAYARGGAKRSTAERSVTAVPVSGSIEKTTTLVAAGVRYSFLKSELFLDAQRDVDANSSGFLIERNELRAYFNHRFTARLRGYLAAYLIDDQSVSGTGLYAPRRYYTGSTGLEWRIRNALSLLGQVDLSSQEFTGGAGSADGNSARISILYRPRRRD